MRLRHWRKKLLWTTSLTLATAVTGCGTTSTASSSAPTTAVIALPVQTSPSWWFPVISSADYGDSNFQMNVMMYVPLIHISRTDGIDYKRSLAQSVTYNAQGTRYVITLNKKWHWSNGHPVTAQDVVFTWNVLKAASTGASNLPWGYGGAGSGGVPTRWTSVTAAGPDTVIVTLNTPSNPNWFIHNGLAQIVPVPASVWDKHPHNMLNELKYILSVANSPSNPVYHVVDGPYQFDQMKPNDFWSFTPNPSYDGHKSSLQKVIFQYESSAATEFLGLRKGTIQVGYLPTSEWNARHELTADKMTTPYQFGFTFLQPNYNVQAPGKLGPVFQKLYVRQALEMGIDQPAMIQAFFHNQGVLENDPIPSQPKTVFYDAQLSHLIYPFNPQRGKALLEQHGWHLHNGVMEKHGVKLAFTLLYVSGSNSAANIVQLVKQDWAQEGIQVSLQSGPFDQVLSTAQQSDPQKWNMAFWGTSSWTYEPDYYPTGGSFYLTGAGANQGGYNDRNMDRLILRSYAPGTPQQIRQALDAYLSYTAHQLPVLFLPYTPSFNEHATDIHGVVATYNPITTFMYPNHWTISG
ncbi:peptide ABC transporter substrate-binding protein [Sulfobacillus sp. hq2]|uniref:peptide ABC transporter substrate-binding protein n=1 Tax=Sulfobacillus TaxID=28033 RepID=UPI000CD0DB7A|nr:peptide ABC transporter substrate-binding protein [Sulfobacillus sp. hq2]POB11485.1 ABC transporter substrate-binding protein [Sulfobacillus sp. hq2]